MRGFPAGRPDGVVAVVLVLALGGSAARAAERPSEVAALEFLEAWSTAWSSGDIDAYLAFYAPDAEVSGRRGEAFRAFKRGLFDRRETVTVRVGDVEIGRADWEGESFLALRFDQDYRSDSLDDFGRKELLVRTAGGRWTVARESWRPTVGTIEVPLQDALAAARLREAEPPASPGAGAASDLPLEPLLGEGYRPTAEPVTRGPDVDDLLATEPLVPAEVTPEHDPVLPGLPPPAAGRRLIEEIVARVNGRVLTRSMLVERVELHREQLLQTQPPDVLERLSALVRETLETTIDRWLLLQEAVDRQADLDGFWLDWLEAVRVETGAESLTEVRQLLEEQGHDIRLLRDQVIEQEIPNLFLQREVGERIALTDEELRAWHDEHRSLFAVPPEVTLRQIFVPVEAGTDPVRAAAVAEEAIERLRLGDEWCAVEEVYGQGGGPCGLVGTVAISDLDPALREAAAGLPVEAVSRPIRSSRGFHVVQVTERRGGLDRPFEEVEGLVRRAAFDELYTQQIDEYLADLRDRGEIEINPRYADALAPVGQ